MRLPLPGVDPVSIALDRVESTGDLRFSGIDLESGARVVVSIDRRATDGPIDQNGLLAQGLVLVLSVETIQARH